MAAVRRSVAAGLATFLTASAPGASGADVEIVRKCVEENAPRKSSVMEVVLETWEVGRRSSEARLRLYWRRLPDGERRLLIRFLAPEDLENSAVLVEGTRSPRPRVHLYLPDFGKPQRITSREQLEGFLGRAGLGIDELATIFDPVAAEELRLLDAEAGVDGRLGWEIETRAADAERARYARTSTFVDRELCVPLRARFFDSYDRLARTLSVEPAQVKKESGSWIPREFVFADVESSLETVVRVRSVEVDVPLAPSLLTPEAMDATAN